jgi:hypothetical protein
MIDGPSTMQCIAYGRPARTIPASLLPMQLNDRIAARGAAIDKAPDTAQMETERFQTQPTSLSQIRIAREGCLFFPPGILPRAGNTIGGCHVIGPS